MPTKCETASLTDGGCHDHNADQLSHSPFLSAASWDSYLESSAAPTARPPAARSLPRSSGMRSKATSAARVGVPCWYQP